MRARQTSVTHSEPAPEKVLNHTVKAHPFRIASPLRGVKLRVSSGEVLAAWSVGMVRFAGF
ncbi:MAG: hypothetical protein H7143_06645 [Pseudorhodobacter sp.]|nr:hypothetical protein [Rhizobacter sp.]